MDSQGEMDQCSASSNSKNQLAICHFLLFLVFFFLILYPPICNLSFYPLHLPSFFQTFILTTLSNLLLLCLLHTFFPSCSTLPHHLFFLSFSLSFIIPLIFTSSGMVLEVLQRLSRALYRPQSAEARGRAGRVRTRKQKRGGGIKQ